MERASSENRSRDVCGTGEERFSQIRLNIPIQSGVSNVDTCEPVDPSEMEE